MTKRRRLALKIEQQENQKITSLGIIDTIPSYPSFAHLPKSKIKEINKIPSNKKWFLSVPKIIHFYWGAKYLSFLRFMSIYSFYKLNPDWQINLYLPEKCIIGTNWKGKQYENLFDGIDYLPIVKKMNINVINFKFKDIGISDDINEVHKSDFIRYYLLAEFGGVWSDIDILYTDPINNISVNKEENGQIENFMYYGSITGEVAGHAIGFLMSSKKSSLFAHLFKSAKLTYKEDDYQCLGADLLNSHFDLPKLKQLCKNNLVLMNKDSVYSIDHNHHKFLYEEDGVHMLGANTIGIHWYGGSEYVEKLTIEVNHNNYFNYKNNGTLILLLKDRYPEVQKYINKLIINNLISCLMITTNIKNRLHLLDKTIKSVQNACNFDLMQKILSIDVFENEKELYYFTKYKWKIIHGVCAGKRGIAENQIRGTSLISSNYVFYSEDDILINKIPELDTLKKIESYVFPDGKKIGYICYNTHIYEFPLKAPETHREYINDKNNYISINGDLFLRKSILIKDEYFLNFPAAIIKTELFRKMQEHIKNNYSGKGIETFFSKSWFDLKFDEEYEVLIYVKNNTLSKLPMSLNDFYYQANMNYWNNDNNLKHYSINFRENSYV